MDDEEELSEADVSRLIEEQEQLRKETDLSFIKKCMMWVLVLCFISVLIFLIVPAFLKSSPRPRDSQALSNSKQAYLVLLDFESDFGHFPDDASAASDPTLHGFKGSHSNDYLGQLIAGGYTTSEEIFYAYDRRYTRRPDDVIAPSTSILDTSECGFSYVLVEENGKRRGMHTKDQLDLPILVAPLVNEWGSCEKKSYKMKGVYLRVDGSARSAPLRSSDQKMEAGGGKTLLESGPSTMWGNLKPVVLLPER